MSYKIQYEVFDDDGECIIVTKEYANEEELASKLNSLMNRPRMKTNGFRGGRWELTYSNGVFAVKFVGN